MRANHYAQAQDIANTITASFASNTHTGQLMEQLRRIVIGLIVAYCAYSAHYIWLLNRTQAACNEAMQGQPNAQELLGAARICSAAGVDARPMLKMVFPQTPLHRPAP